MAAGVIISVLPATLWFESIKSLSICGLFTLLVDLRGILVWSHQRYVVPIGSVRRWQSKERCCCVVDVHGTDVRVLRFAQEKVVSVFVLFGGYFFAKDLAKVAMTMTAFGYILWRLLADKDHRKEKTVGWGERKIHELCLFRHRQRCRNDKREGNVWLQAKRFELRVAFAQQQFTVC